jgi:hypothetical protein
MVAVSLMLLVVLLSLGKLNPLVSVFSVRMILFGNKIMLVLPVIWFLQSKISYEDNSFCFVRRVGVEPTCIL